MVEIAAIGGSAFVLGFRLAGITRIVDLDLIKKNTEAGAIDEVTRLMKNDKVGIIIIDDNTMNKLDERTRENVESSIKPIAVQLSEEGGQDNLRKMIKKSIGIDLWK